jgi:hypothetical protein
MAGFHSYRHLGRRRLNVAEVGDVRNIIATFGCAVLLVLKKSAKPQFLQGHVAICAVATFRT